LGLLFEQLNQIGVKCRRCPSRSSVKLGGAVEFWRTRHLQGHRKSFTCLGIRPSKCGVEDGLHVWQRPDPCAFAFPIGDRTHANTQVFGERTN